MDKIGLSRIFSTAIQREIEAHEFYLKVAERVNNPGVQEIFRELALEELGHKELLERFKSDPTLAMKFQADKPVDYRIAEGTELPKLSIDMKPMDAIALAIKKEQKAMGFYQELARSAHEAELQKIFEGLAEMELGHKIKLENVFVDIGYPEVF
jgi:rubrerythrin